MHDFSEYLGEDERILIEGKSYPEKTKKSSANSSSFNNIHIIFNICYKRKSL